MSTVLLDYTPTERQAFAHSHFADEILYGGAAGGGKSRFLRAEFITYALEVPGSAQAVFRRYYPDLNRPGGMIPGFQMEMPPGIATYNKVEHRWTFKNGSTIDLAAIGRDDDVLKFQGSELQRVAFDEATQFTEYQYRYLMSRLRASGQVKARLVELGRRPSAILTANPGGPGHAWVKARFVDPAPANTLFKPRATLEDPKPGTRIFIPAKVTDNTHIDTSYIDQLNRLPDAQRRALRDGDWDVYEGQVFKEFRARIHVIDPRELPLSLGGIPRAVGVDYGLAAPFCALWGALLPDGLVYVYRELYKAELTPEQQIQAILDAEVDGERIKERPIPVAADPSMWARNPRVPLTQQDTVVDNRLKEQPPVGSNADAYWQRIGSSLEKGRNDRLAGVGLVADKLRVREDGLPRLLISEDCRNLIRTLPALPRDKKHPEDVDTHAEDHAYDALRYLLMHFAGRYGDAVSMEDRIRANRRDPRLAGLRAAAVRDWGGADLAGAGF